MAPTLAMRPATADRWSELEALFGPRGAYAGCWCLYPRLTGREFEAEGAQGRRRRLRDLVERGHEPGLLGELDGAPVGWVSAGPRPWFGRILRSPLFRPDRRDEDPDDPSVWSVVCFFVARSHRGEGLLDTLLDGAVARAGEAGAHAIEGYPVVPGPGTTTEALYWGTLDAFTRAGFEVLAAPSPGRRLVHLELTP